MENKFILFPLFSFLMAHFYFAKNKKHKLKSFENENVSNVSKQFRFYISAAELRSTSLRFISYIHPYYCDLTFTEPIESFF